jgi:hypothetical protein
MLLRRSGYNFCTSAEKEVGKHDANSILRTHTAHIVNTHKVQTQTHTQCSHSAQTVLTQCTSTTQITKQPNTNNTTQHTCPPCRWQCVQVVRRVKEEKCFVAFNPTKEEARDSSVQYTLPDGSVMKVSLAPLLCSLYPLCPLYPLCTVCPLVHVILLMCCS